MSSGFGFGANTNTPGFGQTSFGAQPSGSITFGTPVSSTVGNTSFGQPQTGFGATSFSGFGAQPTQQATPLAQRIGTSMPGFNMSTPTVSNTGFGFGTNPGLAATPSAGGFGTTQVGGTQTGFGFGTPQQQPVSSAPTGLGFGFQTPATTSSFGFGTPTATTSGVSGGFGFGTGLQTGLQSGLQTGLQTSLQQSVATTQPTFSLGLTTSAPSGGLGGGLGGSLGGNLGGNLGAVSTSTGGLFPSQPQNTLGGFFNTPTTSTIGGLTASTTAPTLGLNFGTTTTTTPALSFGAPTTTTTLSTGLGGFGFGLGGTSTTSTLTKPTTTTQSVGLGGIIQSTPKTGTTTNKSEVVPKDEHLPNEIQQTVDAFKTFVKQQKGYSSDVARCSVKEFKKVSEEIEMVSNLLNEVEKQLQSNRAVAEKLKIDTAKGLQCVELAQRTLDTPPGLQYENTAPMEFFVNLVDGFEREMHVLKMQIENTDRYVKNLGKPAALTSEDLAMGMRRLHESFVALAGRLQSVHTQVQSQKEQYLNLRKYMLHDDTNIFEKNNLQKEVLNVTLNNVSYKPPTVVSGPTPFSSLTHPSVIQATVNQNQQINPQAGQQNLFTTQPVGNLFGNVSTSSYVPPVYGGPFFGGNSSSFQLQKPPTGNKRSK